MSLVALQRVEDSDLDALFDQMRDSESVRMAAFTAEDPDNRSAFDAHMARVELPRHFLELVPARPLHARAASDNAGSFRVLQKAGFKAIGTENSFAPARNAGIEETTLRKD